MALILIFISVILSAINVLPVHHWVQELNADLGFWYLAVHLISLPVVFMFAVRGKAPMVYTFVVVPALVGLLFFYSAAVAPFFTGRSVSAVEPAMKLNVMYLNLHGTVARYSELQPLVESVKPDILLVVGLNDFARDKLGFGSKYPHSTEVIRGEGVAVYSSFPFEGAVQKNLGDEGQPPAVLGTLALPNNRKVLLALFQTDPLWSQAQLNLTRLSIRRLATKVREAGVGSIVAGEANFTPFSSFFRSFVNDAELDLYMWGEGPFSTFNLRSRYRSFDVDHFFTGGNVVVLKPQIFWNYGLTHPPMLVHVGIGG